MLTMPEHVLQNATEAYASMLRRHSMYVLKNNGVILNMENLGELDLPYVYENHSLKFKRGNWFIFDVVIGPQLLLSWRKEFSKDTDIIRHSILRHDDFLPKKSPFKESCEDTSWSIHKRKNYFNEMDGEPRYLDVY